MIYGIGIDIVQIKRIEEVYNNHRERFVSRILSNDERSLLPGRKPHTFIAGRFAVKEAIFKAMGGKRSISFTDITILNDSKGKPHVENPVLIAEKLPSLSREHLLQVHISISHERDFAIAMAILEILA